MQWIYCTLIHIFWLSADALWKLRLRLLRGRPMFSKRLLLPAGWLRPRGQPGHSTCRQAYDSALLFVDSPAVIYRLRLTRLQPVQYAVSSPGRRQTVTGFMIVLQPKSKDNHFYEGWGAPCEPIYVFKYDINYTHSYNTMPPTIGAFKHKGTTLK